MRPTPRRNGYSAFSRITLLLALLVGSAGGCSSFDREWKAFPAESSPTGDLAGRWQGTWVSDKSNHSGKLRAIITRLDEGTYTARFDATYLSIIHFGYAMTMGAERRGDATFFEGEADLGTMAGGLYRYKGSTDGKTFESGYESKADYGRFQMTRPNADGKSASD